MHCCVTPLHADKEQDIDTKSASQGTHHCLSRSPAPPQPGRCRLPPAARSLRAGAASSASSLAPLGHSTSCAADNENQPRRQTCCMLGQIASNALVLSPHSGEGHFLRAAFPAPCVPRVAGPGVQLTGTPWLTWPLPGDALHNSLPPQGAWSPETGMRCLHASACRSEQACSGVCWQEHRMGGLVLILNVKHHTCSWQATRMMQSIS